MDITIRVPKSEDPNSALWPTQYHGQEVKVKLNAVVFPDLSYWDLSVIQGGEVISDLELIADDQDKPKGLQQMLGQKVQTLNIEFK